MENTNKVEHLVVDTTAFIKNKALQEVAKNVYTIQEVVDEIKNKRQLRALVVLPYDLTIKDVFVENIQYITEFSKKTGDYSSLSATDIKVMALTYQLEKEKVGTEHLRQDPQVNRIVTVSNGPNLLEAVPGFYRPSSSKASSEVEMKADTTEQDNEESEKMQKELSAKFAYLECGNIDEHDDEMEDVEDVLVPVKDGQEEANRMQEQNEAEDQGDDGFHEDECSDDDDEGWITVDNVAQIKKELNFEESDDEEEITVACITSDFAMQNVLKQLGLHVVAIDGRQIRHLKTYILRCHSCFKTTSVMTKLFCPNCGNKTLTRVAFSLNPDGTQQIHLNARRPITARGKKFSIPKPTGGKHANFPWLCEDQRFPQQRPSRLARMKNNPLDPDYIAGASPFLTRDVNSRSAMLGVRSTEVKHVLGRNPNEPKRKCKK